MPEGIDNPAFLLFAFLSPTLIALIKQAGFSRQTNALIAQVAYIAVGIGGALAMGMPISIENAVPLITTATVVGGAAYNLLWSNIGADSDGNGGLDAKITDATSFVK